MRRYLKLHTVIRTNLKVRSLPDDAARWHYVLALVAAKEASPEGEWLNADYFRAAVDPATAERLAAFLEAELMATEPDGRLVLPQYDYWQASDAEIPAARRDADVAERLHKQQRAASKAYRDRKRAAIVMPTSYDASLQVSKLVSNESTHDGCSLCGQPVTRDDEVVIPGGATAHRACVESKQ